MSVRVWVRNCVEINRILAFVIMENHLHWIAVGPQLPKRVGEFKSFTANDHQKDAGETI
jgi:REP element-mobilizing transposase RayT